MFRVECVCVFVHTRVGIRGEKGEVGVLWESEGPMALICAVDA